VTSFYTKYSSLGASSRVRCLQYLSKISDAKPLFDDEYVTNRYAGKRKFISVLKYYIARVGTLMKETDQVVYVEKEFFPYWPFFLEYLILRMTILKSGRRKLIVDIDDGIFVNYQNSVIRRLILGKKIEKILQIADSVICGSENLLNYCQKYNTNCSKIPSTYNPGTTPVVKLISKDQPIIIGWIGTPNTQRYLYRFFQDLDNNVYNRVKFKLIGASKDILRGLNEKIQIEIIPWTLEAEKTHLQEIHFGMMPLDEKKFDYYKCGYKLVQYLAHGKPCFAYDYGENSNIIVDGENGLLFKKIDQNRKLDMLVNIPNDKYSEMSEKAFETYNHKYSFSLVKQKFKNATKN
jgi:glycosyltransferase involved in cell wall biosynthesis